MRTIRNAAALVLGLVLGGGTVAAWGAVGNVMSWVGASGMVWKAPDGSIRSLSNPYWEGFSSGANGGVLGKLGQKAGMQGGGSLVIDIGRQIPAATIGRLAAQLAKVGGPAAIGLTLAPLVWDAAQGWLYPGDELDPTDGPQGSYRNNLCSTNGHSTPREACLQTNVCASGANWPGTWKKGSGVYYACARADGTFHPTAVTASLQCPEGTVYNGSTCVPAGSRPATDQEIADTIIFQGQELDRMSDLAQKILQSGFEDELIADAGPVVSSGPASVPGSSSTSTTSGPSGQTTTTNNTTHNVTYNSNVINVTTTTISTTVAPDGTTTSDTTTDGTEEVPPVEEPKPFCELYPDAAACAELGETPDEEIDEEVRNVGLLEYQSVAGSCPNPMQFSVAGHSQEISYEFICDGAEALRPLLIALGMLSAGIFVFGAIGGRQA